jgi:hypothetical protein
MEEGAPDDACGMPITVPSTQEETALLIFRSDVRVLAENHAVPHHVQSNVDDKHRKAVASFEFSDNFANDSNEVCVGVGVVAEYLKRMKVFE